MDIQIEQPEYLELPHGWIINTALIHNLPSIDDDDERSRQLYTDMVHKLMSLESLDDMDFGQTLCFNTLHKMGIITHT